MGAHRIGVVADTHCPEFLDRLPASLWPALEGVELILHAGDLGGASTLAELEGIAPVIAVRGDHDRELDLPSEQQVEIGGRRVVIVHGNRSHLVEEPFTFIGTVTLGHYWPTHGLHRFLARRFPSADVVVYGHTHAAATVRVGAQLHFNPGAVYQVGREEAERRLSRRPGWFERAWLEVIRHRRRIPRPSVGILTIGEGRVEAEVIPL